MIARSAIVLGRFPVESELVPAVADDLPITVLLQAKVQVGPAHTPALLHQAAADGFELSAEVTEAAAVQVAPHIAIPLGGVVQEAGVGLVINKEYAAKVFSVPLGLILIMCVCVWGGRGAGQA